MNFTDRYTYDPVNDLIGTGGFSKIYKAYDSLREEYVALKFFSADVKEKYGIVAEAKRLLKLYHPNVVRFYDLETIERQNVHLQQEQVLVGVLEFIDSGDLSKAKELNLNDQFKFEITMGFVRSLEYIHQQGLIHRDIKPHNILLKSKQGGGYEPKLADFGISKTTEDGATSSSQLLGTVEYMAPEQFNPDKYGKVSQPTDLWSMAVVIYELYTGTRMFGSRSGGQSTEQVISKILIDEIPDDFSALPERIQNLLNMCLVREISGRENSATNILKMLEGHNTGSIPKEAIRSTMSVDPDATAVIGADSIPKEPTDPDATKVITGDVIKEAQKTTEPPPPVEPPPTTSKPQPEPIAAEPATSGPVTAQPVAPAKKGKGKMIGIIAAAVVVIGGGTWAAMTFTGNEATNDNNDDTEIVEVINPQEVLNTGMTAMYELNYEDALKGFEEAAKLGNGEAGYMMGMLYANGFGVQKDIYKASEIFVQWTNDSLTSEVVNLNRYGLAMLAIEYPELFNEQALNTNKNDYDAIFRDAFRVIKGKADTNLFYQNELGELYYDGVGTDMDIDKAYELFAGAAEHDYAPAHTMLGTMALWEEIPVAAMTDDMLEMTPEELAKSYFQKGVDQNYASAQDNLGWILWDSEGSPEGINLMTKAANQGNDWSMLGLGDCYYYGGETIEKDYDEAIKWFTMAADAYNLDGAYSAGKLYYEGKVVDGVSVIEQNQEKGLKYLQFAARNGHERAQNFLLDNGETWGETEYGTVTATF